MAQQMGFPPNLKSGTGLEEGINLNDLMTPGCYAGYTNGAYVNIPSGITTFILEVRTLVANWDVCVQTLYATSGSAIYERMKWGANSWGEWYKL